MNSFHKIVSFKQVVKLHHLLLYKAPGQEETTLGDNFLCKQKGLIILIISCMFQKTALPSDFMHSFFFHDFIHVHSPWAGADNPLGPKFLCQQEGLIAMVICCKFKKKISSTSDFIHIFSWFNNLIFFMFISFPAIIYWLKDFVHSSINEKCSSRKSALSIWAAGWQKGPYDKIWKFESDE